MTNTSKTARPDMYRFHNGTKSPLPFDTAEYEARLEELRERMDAAGTTAAVFTSMHISPIIRAFCIAPLVAPMGWW